MTDSESERERLRVKERVREIVGMCQVLECVIVGKCERERIFVLWEREGEK